MLECKRYTFLASTLNLHMLMTTTMTAFTLVPFPNGGLHECTGGPFVHRRPCLPPHSCNRIILGCLASSLQDHIRHAADITHASHLPCYEPARNFVTPHRLHHPVEPSSVHCGPIRTPPHPLLFVVRVEYKHGTVIERKVNLRVSDPCTPALIELEVCQEVAESRWTADCIPTQTHIHIHTYTLTPGGTTC